MLNQTAHPFNDCPRSQKKYHCQISGIPYSITSFAWAAPSIIAHQHQPLPPPQEQKHIEPDEDASNHISILDPPHVIRPKLLASWTSRFAHVTGVAALVFLLFRSLELLKLFPQLCQFLFQVSIFLL